MLVVIQNVTLKFLHEEDHDDNVDTTMITKPQLIFLKKKKKIKKLSIVLLKHVSDIYKIYVTNTVSFFKN